ncbi:MAG: oligosaccharide flippase family protein [Nitrincola lacisaponensis]|uniref:oligosaccharide flippase family protein n=1 Tax=Nitrincola lacisaponensis TaxID=267850 RepID=UPI00391C6727
MNTVVSDKKRVLRAGFWVLAAFGFAQFLRLIGNLITTRLLEPEMFGIMALVYAVLAGLAMLTDAGLWAYIVRNKRGDQPEVYNVAWSVQVVRGFLICGIILSIVIFIQFFLSQDVKDSIGIYGSTSFLMVITVIGFGSILNGFVSMAAAIESRELKRGKIELMEVLSQFVGISVMIVWAYLYPTIWALVAASLVTTLVKFILSYSIFPYRHKFNFDQKVISELYSFSKWILLASVLTYIAQQGDRLFFGVKIPADMLGVYGIAVLLSTTIALVTNQVISKVLFPMYSKVQGNKYSLSRIYYKSRLFLDAGLYSITAVLFLISISIVEFLYDERYHQAGHMLKILILALPGIALTSAAQECLTALGKTKIRTLVMFVRMLGLAILLPVGFHYYSMMGAVVAVAINPWLGLPVLIYKMNKEGLYDWKKEFRAVPIGLLVLTITYLIMVNVFDQVVI